MSTKETSGRKPKKTKQLTLSLQGEQGLRKALISGEAIRQLREAQGLSKQELAELAAQRLGDTHGVPGLVQTIRAWEEGGHLPRIDVQDAVTGALGVSSKRILADDFDFGSYVEDLNALQFVNDFQLLKGTYAAIGYALLHNEVNLLKQSRGIPLSETDLRPAYYEELEKLSDYDSIPQEGADGIKDVAQRLRAARKALGLSLNEAALAISYKTKKALAEAAKGETLPPMKAVGKGSLVQYESGKHRKPTPPAMNAIAYAYSEVAKDRGLSNRYSAEWFRYGGNAERVEGMFFYSDRAMAILKEYNQLDMDSRIRMFSVFQTLSLLQDKAEGRCNTGKFWVSRTRLDNFMYTKKDADEAKAKVERELEETLRAAGENEDKEYEEDTEFN